MLTNATPSLESQPEMLQLRLTAPKLLDASINVVFCVLPLPLPPTWAGLQVLEWIFQAPNRGFLHAISTMRHLTTPTLKINEDRMAWRPSTDVFTLASVRYLNLHGHAYSIGKLVGLILVPKLTDLSVVGSPSMQQSDLQPVTDMLRRSLCRLLRLNPSLRSYGALTHPDSGRILSHLTTLQELHISVWERFECEGSELALKMLQNTTVTFPRLKDVHLVISEYPHRPSRGRTKQSPERWPR